MSRDSDWHGFSWKNLFVSELDLAAQSSDFTGPKTLVKVYAPVFCGGVSATFAGVARSVTRSLCVTVARSPTTRVRHGVVSVRGLVSCPSGRVSRKCRVVASSDEWKEPAEADVTKLLKPEGNVLLAECRNDGGTAGLVLKLVITTGNRLRRFARVTPSS